MSKKEEKVFEKELGSKENKPLYDFLYNDTRRIASFLSQVNELGYLQQVKESELLGSGVKQVTEGKSSFKIPAIAEAGGGFQIAPYEKEEQNLEKTYDPLWIHAVNFLNYLANQKLLQKDLNQAHLGQFLEISGQLHLIDFETFKEAYVSPSFFKEAKIKDRETQQLISRIMKNLPYSLQGHLVNKVTNIWFTLDKTCLTGQASDVIMKHGVTLNGIWKIIGILDVRPNEDTNEQSMDIVNTDFKQNPSWHNIKQVIDSFHLMLGRPQNVASVTPLLIYRDVLK